MCTDIIEESLLRTMTLSFSRVSIFVFLRVLPSLPFSLLAFLCFLSLVLLLTLMFCEIYC